MSSLTARAIFLQLAEMFHAHRHCWEYPQQWLIDGHPLVFPFGITGRAPGRFFAKQFVRWQITYPPLKRQDVKIRALRKSLKDTGPFCSL